MQSLQRAGFAVRQALHQLHLPAAFYSVQVVVPSLGESITDGTIASVLKASGDAVKENETIAQIETDKVTIDIKAPSDGTILGVVVQEQDTVVPGQLVATLDDKAAQANLIGSTPRPAASTQQSAPAAAPAASTAPPAAAPASHRTPGIRFPPRVTPEGQRVSTLSAAEAHAFLQRWQQPTAGAAEATPAAPSAPAASPSGPPAPTQQGSDAANRLFAGGRSASGSAAGAAAPSKFATSVRQLDKMPARKELTDKEMELIELGGAL